MYGITRTKHLHLRTFRTSLFEGDDDDESDLSLVTAPGALWLDEDDHDDDL